MSNTYPPSAQQNPDLVTRQTPEQTSGTSAQERAAEVKDTSVAAGQHVAGVTKEELHKVASESRRQAKDLYRQTQSELADQAATQQKRVASGIRSIGDEFGAMAESSKNQGVASDLAHEASSRAAGIADWLDRRDPGSLLDEVKGFARRRPGTFIAIAAAAGVLAGRLTRSVIEESKDSPGSDASSGSGASSAAGVAANVNARTDATTHLVTDYPGFQGTRDDE